MGLLGIVVLGSSTGRRRGVGKDSLMPLLWGCASQRYWPIRFSDMRFRYAVVFVGTLPVQAVFVRMVLATIRSRRGIVECRPLRDAESAPIVAAGRCRTA